MGPFKRRKNRLEAGIHPRGCAAPFADVLQEGGHHRQQGLRLPLRQNQQERVDGAQHASTPQGIIDSFFRKIMPSSVSGQMQGQEQLQQGGLLAPSLQIGGSSTDPEMPSIASSSSAYFATGKLVQNHYFSAEM